MAEARQLDAGTAPRAAPAGEPVTEPLIGATEVAEDLQVIDLDDEPTIGSENYIG